MGKPISVEGSIVIRKAEGPFKLLENSCDLPLDRSLRKVTERQAMKEVSQ